MSWLLPLITGIAASLSLFLSKPEKKKLALVTVILILLPSFFEAYSSFQEKKHLEAVQVHYINQLSKETEHYLTFVRDMIFYSSDGWLPETEEDFFSQNSAELICNHLNVDNTAPVIPDRAWRAWIGEQSKSYKASLNEIMVDYSDSLGAELVRKISVVESSLILGGCPNSALMRPIVNKRYGRSYPPVFCSGAEKIIAENLNEIFILYKEIRNAEDLLEIKRDWGFLSMSTDNRWPKKLLGKDRIN